MTTSSRATQPTTTRAETPCTDFCSLPSDEVGRRAALIRAELVPHVAHQEPLPAGLAWEFEGGPEMKARLEEFIQFERRCCAGMTFDLADTSAGRIRLEIVGEGADAFAALATGAGTAGPPSSHFSRALKAGGLGVGASFFVCCLLPLGVTAVAGAAAAAPLAPLDQPLYIGVGGILAACAAWAYLGRRDRPACDDC